MSDVSYDPPTRDVGTQRPHQSAGQRAVARIASPLKVGKTVWKKDGSWHIGTSPSADTIADADHVFVGGHTYQISQELFDEIEAADL